MQAFKIIEQDGRYIWVAHPGTTNPTGLGFSPISFSTEDAAVEARLKCPLSG